MEEPIFSPDPAAAHTFLFLPQSLEGMTHCKVPFVRSTKTLPVG